LGKLVPASEYPIGSDDTDRKDHNNNHNFDDRVATPRIAMVGWLHGG
jgi:hypothetical protein